MNPVLSILSKRLDYSTREDLQKRFEALMRGIKFEADRQSLYWLKVINRGWNYERLEILCCLNVFYQIILGPLASSSRGGNQFGLITEHPISYGRKLKIDSE